MMTQNATTLRKTTLPATGRGALAVLECAAALALAFLVMGAISASPLGAWERQTLRRPFLENAALLLTPLLVLVLARRDLAAYGMTLRPLRYHLGVVLICVVPVMIANVSLMFFNYRRLPDALILSAVSFALLGCLAWLLRRVPAAPAPGGGPLLLVMLALPAALDPGWMLSAFLFFLLFVGLAEETMFRGYVQSRLNEAYGKPWRFAGVAWGPGVLITVFFFGTMHFLNLAALFNGVADFQPWWAVWTMTGSLVFSFVREKTGSVAAPAILHGLPQAISYPLLGL